MKIISNSEILLEKKKSSSEYSSREHSNGELRDVSFQERSNQDFKTEII